MIINTYVKKWCDEDYRVEKEDFYAANAEYVVNRSWASGGFKHGIWAIVVSLLYGLFTGGDDLLNMFSLIGAMSLCFLFYGMRTYGANDLSTGAGIYLMLGVVLFIAGFKATDALKVIFAFLTNILFIYLSFIRPIVFMKTFFEMRRRVKEEESEEDEFDNKTYKTWEAGYKAYRYELPSPEEADSDPLLKEAQKLFEGYTDNKQVLKTRYRKLAKQYHPDVGGDTQLFQRIVYVYEELQKTVV